MADKKKTAKKPAKKMYVYIKWWGRYSSGGSEGKHDPIEQVPDGTDDEIENYIEDALLYGSAENYQSEHWRGVAFRRLTRKETKAFIEKRFLDHMTRFLHEVFETDPETTRRLLRGMVQIDGFPRVGMTRVRDLFSEALEGINDASDVVS